MLPDDSLALLSKHCWVKEDVAGFVGKSATWSVCIAGVVAYREIAPFTYR
jgi:hypothetical protein